MANYEVKTQNDLTKWWFINAGSGGRLSDLMDDFPSGPAIYYTTGWTAAGAEWYRTQATANDSCQEKIGAGAWAALVLGSGIGALNAGEYFYDVATTRLYVRLTGDAAPNATNQVRAHYLWDGSGAGPAFMTETVEDGVYLIHLPLEVGDGTTATTLTSKAEFVYFDGCYPSLQGNATLQLGVLSGTKGIDGSAWKFSYSDGFYLLAAGQTTAILKIYDSKLIADISVSAKLVYMQSANTLDIRQSQLSSLKMMTGNRIGYLMGGSITNFSLTDVYITDSSAAYLYQSGTFKNISSHAGANYGLQAAIATNITITGLEITETAIDVRAGSSARNLYMVDLINPIVTPSIGHADGVIYEQYTVNITVVDKDETGIVGATVTCVGSDSGTASEEYDTAVFSVDTGASGILAEQTVTARKWVGTDETLTNYNYFKFTISEPGYETLVMEKVTIDAPIVWHLELQSIKHPPAPWEF